ncbi:MAG: GAF domain-containing protein [Chloroflexota bacterium]
MIKTTNERMLQNTARLRTLFQLSLLDEKYETVYDLLTQLAHDIVDAPVSLMSMVSADFQYFKSQVGLPEQWAKKRRTPLSHSFCQHVVASNQPLIVEDARQNDLVRNNLAIRDLDVIGYLGIPLTLEDGKPLGSFCVIDSQPRAWTETEIAIMTELAQIVTLEFDARTYVNRNKMTKEEYTDLQERIVAFSKQIAPNADKETVLATVRKARTEYNLHTLDI